MESQKYLSPRNLDEFRGFSVVRPAAVIRDRSNIGLEKSNQILSSASGESGWIPNHEIDRQVSWHDDGTWGYAFETELSKSEIVSRYEESELQEFPVGSYGGYTLFERTHSWHAVDETGVIKIPSRRKADVESYIDNLDRGNSSHLNVRKILAELDSRYSFRTTLPYSSGRSFKDSEINYRGLCHAISPYTEGDDFTMTTGIITNSSERLAKWAAEQDWITFGELIHKKPAIRTADGLVLLEETGTVDSFAAYRS